MVDPIIYELQLEFSCSCHKDTAFNLMHFSQSRTFFLPLTSFFFYVIIKRHARSKKLLNEGRLKLVLNSDGEIEEDEETHAERHARTMSLTQVQHILDCS